MTRRKQFRLAWVTGLLLLLTPAATGQLQPIPEMPMTLNGQVSAGYAGGTGAGVPVTGGVFFGVAANLDAYYHDPRVLKFNLGGIYHWDEQTAGTLTGNNDNNESFIGNVNFLGGSSIPLNFQFSWQRTNTSTLSSGETPLTVASTGIAKNFTINWSARKRHYPSFAISYSWGSTDASFTGLSASESTSSHSSLNLSSTYSLLGFHLSGSYSMGQSNAQTPDIFNLGTTGTATSDFSGANFIVDRSLPLNTHVTLQYNHSDTNYDTYGTPQNASFDIETASISSTPTRRLSLSAMATDNSNAAAQAITQVLATGSTGVTSGAAASTTAPQLLLASGRSFTVNDSASYDVGHGFFVLASSGHDSASSLDGTKAVSDTYSGGVGYSRRLFRGILGLTYTPAYAIFQSDIPAVLTVGEAPVVLSFTTHALFQGGMVTYARRFGRWQAHGNFAYSENDTTQQLALPLQSRSLYTNVRANTRLRQRWNLNVNASIIDTSVQGQQGTLSQTYGGQISEKNWSLNLQENLNHGYSIVNTLGQVTNVSVTTALSGVISNTYRSDSSAFLVSVANRRRHMDWYATFTRGGSTLYGLTSPATVGNTSLETRVTYKFRKINLQGGYRWYTQSASSNSQLNQTVQVFWISAVRQFHVF